MICNVCRQERKKCCICEREFKDSKNMYHWETDKRICHICFNCLKRMIAGSYRD